MGTTRFLPFNFRYLLSFGLIATAVSPKIVSGLVVATICVLQNFQFYILENIILILFNIYLLHWKEL